MPSESRYHTEHYSSMVRVRVRVSPTTKPPRVYLVTFPVSCSLKSMRKALLEAKAAKRVAEASAAAAAAGAAEEAAEKAEPLEWGRILTEDDFERIRCVPQLL